MIDVHRLHGLYACPMLPARKHLTWHVRRLSVPHQRPMCTLPYKTPGFDGPEGTEWR